MASPASRVEVPYGIAIPALMLIGESAELLARDAAMMDQGMIAKAAASLEPLPPTVNRLAATIAREDSGLGEIEEIVSLDPVLTARLLKAANTAADTRGATIFTVRRALMKIGSGRVLALALSGPLGRRMRQRITAYGLSEGALWRHVVASALAVELIGPLSKVSVPPEAFATALLHDLGMIVLTQFLDPEMQRLIALARADGLSTREAELEILGVHQGDVGALVAQEWQLPESMVRAISFAGVSGGGDDPLFDFVHLSHVVAGRIGEYPGMPPSDLEIDPAVLERTGIALASIDPMLGQLKERLGGLLRLYGA